MARLRQRFTPDERAVMPLELLGPDARAERCRWYVTHGLWSWADQHAALTRAREEHGLTDGSDPRELLRDLPTHALPIRRHRRTSDRNRT
jgi:hypothetical protein